MVIKLLPKRWDNWFTKTISTIGKSTYHILLTQILYFAIVLSIYGDHYGASIFGIKTISAFPLSMEEFLTILGYLIVNWVICINLGVSWYYAEFSLRKYLAKKKGRIPEVQLIKE
jgi:hypothetical protein